MKAGASRTLVALLVALVLTDSAWGQTGVTRSKRGDTTVVTSPGNGKWGPPHDAIEVLRTPGDTKETIFGAAYILAATADGGVIVSDTKGAEGLIVRQFDANGKFVRNIGRSGPGPGEYMRENLTLATDRTGHVYVRDDDRSISVFGPDGKFVTSIPLNFNNGSTTEISIASDGSIYVRAPFVASVGGRMAAAAGQRPMFHYSAAGKLLDSVALTTRWLPETVGVAQWWRLLPDGRILFSRNDKFGFLVASGSGDRALLLAEGPVAPVPYLAEEREQLRMGRNLIRDKCGHPENPVAVIPDVKPAAKGVVIDLDGRIWIIRSTMSKKVEPRIIASCSSAAGQFKAETTYEEPPAFAAFMADGTFLGEVRFPMKARVTFAGNTAWALVPNDDGEQTLVKYRLY